MKNRILLFVLSFLALQGNAQCTWTGGGGNNNWSNAGNWSCGHVPTATDDVVINTLNTAVIMDIATISITSLTISYAGSGQEPVLSGNCDILISGALNFNAGFIDGSGALTVGGLVTITGYVSLGPRTLTLNGGAEFTGNSTLYSRCPDAMQFTTVIIPLNKILKSTTTAGQFQSFENATFDTSKLINYGTIEKNGIGHFICYVEFTNTGTIHVKAGSFGDSRCSTFINLTNDINNHTGATFIMEADATYSQFSRTNYTNCTMSGAGTFDIIVGTFSCSGNYITNFISGNTISSKFKVGRGTLNLSQNITLADVEMINATVNGTGTMTIPTGGHAELSGTLNIPFINQGTIGVNAIFNNTFSNSGIIQSKQNGIGSLSLTNAIVTNTGTFSPGNPESGFPIGYINVYSFNNSTSTLAIELAGYSGPSLGIGNDQLYSDNVNLVTLSGTLNISFINGFTPILNDVFTIMTCSNGCSGNFSSIVSPISPTRMWEVDVTTNPNEVRIKLVPIPPTVCTWNGTTGNWSDATKWSCGQVPTSNNNVVINSGTVTLDGANGTTVSIVDMTLSGGTLTSMNNNTLALSGALAWSGGTIGGTGTMTVAMATTITNAPTLDTRSLTLNGGGTIEGGFNTSNGANLIIPLSKTLTVTNSTLILWGGNGGTLTLAGTLIKNGVGALECNFQTFQNTGTVNINEGTLRMGYGGTHSGATFNMATYLGVNRFLTIRGGTHTFNGCTFAGTGGFFVTENATVSTFTNNTVGSMLSNFSIGGTSTFNLGQSIVDLNLFTYFSTNTLTGTGNITANTVTMSNGTLNFTGNLNIGSLNWSGGTIGSMVHTTLGPGSVGTTSNTVTTNGRFTINGTLTIQSGVFNCNRFDNNDGDMTIQSGTVNANGEFGNFGRLILQTGSFNANADFYNATYLKIQGGTFTANTAFFNSAVLIIESGILNAVGAFSNSNTVQIQTGTLNAASTFDNNGVLRGNGTLSCSTNFLNVGRVAPGLSPGTLTINPSVVNDPTGIMEMEIENSGTLAAPNMAKDLLNSTGNIQLAGTLNILTTGDIPNGTYKIIESTSGTVTGGFTDVSLNYDVVPANYAISYGPNSVSIVVSSPLPVELLAFKAKYTEGGNLLTWQTANEVNNKGFQVERIMDNGQWAILGFVTAKGKAANYEFVDNAPLSAGSSLNSTSYYRLRQMDNDGKEAFSKVISVSRKGNSKLKVSPNPVSNMLIIETDVDLVRNETNTFQIFNLLGQQVLMGTMAQRIDVSALPQGTYFLKVGVEQVKFIKQ